ncbi:HXXEE domain-containing protein [Streptomyces cavernicola]|uniref:HXXEE domain-containing protein n=1 Tax=Streptomyces cavernicola TaxID=3043613 RepID=A0ABT6SAU7_9ACTN|nr:HXXEE domain-containing protein [Streptomyces sp. B-S-A6]MDI3404797.1 HXXEE domain-containing protein [Streptomyces sp. B-S-A6]
MDRTAPGRKPDDTTAVTLGLFAAWLVHDLEELATVPRWTRTRVPALRRRFPQVPERLWRSMEGMHGREFALAVAGVGLVMASAAADGHRTGGRSAYYQSVLGGFGLHGLVHLAQAAAVRGYTPGSVTSPLLVVPFTLWARGRLRRAGVLRPTTAADAALSLGLAAATAVGAHAAARKLLGARSTTS